jgi:hypothetical protein
MTFICYEILKEKKRYFSCYTTVLEFFESVRDSWFVTFVFRDDDPDALPKVPEDPTLNCHLFVMFHTFANQIFLSINTFFIAVKKDFLEPHSPLSYCVNGNICLEFTLSQVTPPVLEPVLWGITVIKSKLQVNPASTACRLTSQDLHLGTRGRHVVTFTPLFCLLLCLY